GLEDQPRPAALGDELADLLRGRVVVCRRAGLHEHELDVRLIGEFDREPAHRAEVGVRGYDHAELADVEVERLVLVEYVDEGVTDSVGHGSKVGKSRPERFSKAAVFRLRVRSSTGVPARSERLSSRAKCRT